jgi:hypothetical protein
MIALNIWIGELVFDATHGIKGNRLGGQKLVFHKAKGRFHKVQRHAPTHHAPTRGNFHPPCPFAKMETATAIPFSRENTNVVEQKGVFSRGACGLRMD